jgi:uroporphyrinogen decarboxylase
MTPTARQRISAALRGEILDRAPFAVWRHFYVEEQPERGDALAERLVAFVRAHQLDLLKYNPRAQYHAEPWGTTYRYDGDAHPEVVRYAVADSSAWRDIHPVEPAGGVFDEMLEGITFAREELPEVPLVMTIFTPLAICERLSGRERLLADLRARPTDVLGALDAVTWTFSGFAQACIAAGADGIFLATTQWAQRDTLRADEYAEFGRPFDLRILDAVAGAPLNVLHVCGPNARVLELADYPVAAISWNVHARGNPSPSAFLATVDARAGIGGFSDDAFTSADEAHLRAEADWLSAQAPRRWIAAGGCTIPVTSRERNIDRARALLAETAGSWTR